MTMFMFNITIFAKTIFAFFFTISLNFFCVYVD